MKKAVKKTLYFDVGTEVKLKKATKRTKKSTSKIIRMWVASPKFDTYVEELNNQLEE